jgi:hypothetical protein
MYRGHNQGGRQKFFARQSMTPRKDRMMNIATRFKYRMHLNCHDERQAGFDGACRDDSISSNSYCPYPTLSKYGSAHNLQEIHEPAHQELAYPFHKIS